MKQKLKGRGLFGGALLAFACVACCAIPLIGAVGAGAGLAGVSTFFAGEKWLLGGVLALGGAALMWFAWRAIRSRVAEHRRNCEHRCDASGNCCAGKE